MKPIRTNKYHNSKKGLIKLLPILKAYDRLKRVWFIKIKIYTSKSSVVCVISGHKTLGSPGMVQKHRLRRSQEKEKYTISIWNVGSLNSALWLADLALTSQVGQSQCWIEWAYILDTLPLLMVFLPYLNKTYSKS